MFYNCILFSSFFLLLVVTCSCSPVLNKGDLTERNKRLFGDVVTGFVCTIKLCSVCRNKKDEFHCCKCTCFPGMAKAKLQNGKSVAMAELQIGDSVQTVSPGGKLHYSKVISFLTKDESTTTWYMSITTTVNNTIYLSGNHLIYSRKNSSGKFTPMFADEVSIGDDVLVAGNDELSSEKVTYITSLTMQGAYVPLTEDGNIVVQGVLASCYASFDHDLAHLIMIPMKWYPKRTEWIFGVNSGSPEYVEIAKGFGRWVLPSMLLY